mmetsp:Transcript_3716/g.6231  ORF Transcript_3716/g.6231 Transcript_3716/m.6231 type:complete len:224 (-) Transcript_3716:1377-2048(-)
MWTISVLRTSHGCERRGIATFQTLLVCEPALRKSLIDGADAPLMAAGQHSYRSVSFERSPETPRPWGALQPASPDAPARGPLQFRGLTQGRTCHVPLFRILARRQGSTSHRPLSRVKGSGRRWRPLVQQRRQRLNPERRKATERHRLPQVLPLGYGWCRQPSWSWSSTGWFVPLVWTTMWPCRSLQMSFQRRSMRNLLVSLAFHARAKPVALLPHTSLQPCWS